MQKQLWNERRDEGADSYGSPMNSSLRTSSANGGRLMRLSGHSGQACRQDPNPADTRRSPSYIQASGHQNTAYGGQKPRAQQKKGTYQPTDWTEWKPTVRDREGSVILGDVKIGDGGTVARDNAFGSQNQPQQNHLRVGNLYVGRDGYFADQNTGWPAGGLRQGNATQMSGDTSDNAREESQGESDVDTLDCTSDCTGCPPGD